MFAQQEILHQDSKLTLAPIGEANLGIQGLSPVTGSSGQVPFPPFQMMLAGEPLCNAYGFNSGNGGLPYAACCTAMENSDTELTLEYTYDNGLVVTCRIEKLPQGLFRQVNRIENRGEQPVVLQQFASTMLCGIGAGGLMSWNDDRKIKLHFCYNPWEAWKGKAGPSLCPRWECARPPLTWCPPLLISPAAAPGAPAAIFP